MEQIRSAQIGCNGFLASRMERDEHARGRVRLVVGFGFALITILSTAPGCSRSPVDRIRKIQALPREARTFAKLRRDLASKDPGIRAAAVSTVDVASGPEAAHAVSAALADPDPRVRSMAALRLGEIRDPASVGLLVDRVQQDPD